MLPRERPGRIHVAVDDSRWVVSDGLLLPVTSAHQLGLSHLVDQDVDLRYRNHRHLVTLPSSTAAGRATTPADITENHDDHEHRTGSLQPRH